MFLVSVGVDCPRGSFSFSTVGWFRSNKHSRHLKQGEFTWFYILQQEFKGECHYFVTPAGFFCLTLIPHGVSKQSYSPQLGFYFLRCRTEMEQCLPVPPFQPTLRTFSTNWQGLWSPSTWFGVHLWPGRMAKSKYWVVDFLICRKDQHEESVHFCLESESFITTGLKTRIYLFCQIRYAVYSYTYYGLWLAERK